MHPDFSQVPFQPLSLPAFIAAFIGAPCTDAFPPGWRILQLLFCFEYSAINCVILSAGTPSAYENSLYNACSRSI
jgi:hypothetical protein